MVRRYVLVSVLSLLLLAPLGFAQDEPDVRWLARDAGLIFSGAVERIERPAPASRGEIGVVRVTFRIAEALRGATAGQTLTISEWAALWASSDRYRVGESLLLFLYPPSGDLGLTTTVGGDRGRISLADSQLSMSAVQREIEGSEDTVIDDEGRERPSPKYQRRTSRLQRVD